MPLKQGSSKKAFEFNVGELIRSWKKKGAIGKKKIGTLEKARKTALAIAFDQKRRSG